jgi:hypothetical protein
VRERGPSPSTLERLQVERVAIANAWVHFADMDLAGRLARESGSPPACRAAAKRFPKAVFVQVKTHFGSER